MKHIACAIAAIALSLASTSAAAKSETIKIEVIDSELNQPIEVVDPAIYRGVEGQWFNATPEWENLVRPTIERDGGRRVD